MRTMVQAATSHMEQCLEGPARAVERQTQMVRGLSDMMEGLLEDAMSIDWSLAAEFRNEDGMTAQEPNVFLTISNNARVPLREGHWACAALPVGDAGARTLLPIEPSGQDTVQPYSSETYEIPLPSLPVSGPMAIRGEFSCAAPSSSRRLARAAERSLPSFFRIAWDRCTVQRSEDTELVASHVPARRVRERLSIPPAWGLDDLSFHAHGLYVHLCVSSAGSEVDIRVGVTGEREDKYDELVRFLQGLQEDDPE